LPHCDAGATFRCMGTLEYNRLRSRRYVRARARGLSREAACRIAGYHEAGATRIERRLKGEIERERQKLAGIFGHVPPTFSQGDARRILDDALGRLADNTFRPHAKRLEAQELREL